MAGTSSQAQKVVIAMSGGVDSSVAAAVLVQEGYDVIGMTMLIRNPMTGPEEQFDRVCASSAAVADARKVAEKLGIPHYAVDLRDLFEKEIIGNFIDEYRHGRTPNPCVRCNRMVKFGALLEKARELGADLMATGHYARIAYDDLVKRWLLKRGLDHSKDQSYALYGLSQDQLAHALFPIGNIGKDETRRLASELGLSVASKPESQEICFVERDYGTFLEDAVPEIAKPGPILDTSGKVLGEHRGVAFYTIGQRKGLGIAVGEPVYVVGIDPETNTVIVGQNEDLFAKELVAVEVNYIAISRLDRPIAVTAKVRYNMKDAEASLAPMDDEQASLVFDRPQRAITPGQAVVFYDGENVVGGGTIDRVLR